MKDNNEKLTTLGAWNKELSEYKIPKWEDLPEIDLYMDQVVSIIEKCLGIYSGISVNKTITPSIINNYVKLGIIPPPVKKKYSRTHIAYLIIICILKQVLPIASIQALIILQEQIYPINQIFNQFCDIYEKTTVETLNNSKLESLLSVNPDDQTLYKLALTMSNQANASKMLSEKIIWMDKSIIDEHTQRS